MKYVIDASVGFKWAVSEIHSDKATLLRDDFNNAIHELLAPDLFPTEIANALAVAERAGRIKPVEAALGGEGEGKAVGGGTATAWVTLVTESVEQCR